jgi:hypothetical protein
MPRSLYDCRRRGGRQHRAEKTSDYTSLMFKACSTSSTTSELYSITEGTNTCGVCYVPGTVFSSFTKLYQLL